MSIYNIELLNERLAFVESQMDDVVDQMIEKYGKFVDWYDVEGKDDQEKKRLISEYNTLQQEKSRIMSKVGM